MNMDVFWKLNFLIKVSIKWNFDYLFSLLGRKKYPVHLIFCLVDHYEPGTGGVPPEIEKTRVNELLEKYPVLANKHKDYYGNKPKRTWFFPPHYHRLGNLRKLVSLCEDGYGEIELHLHHGKIQPDTAKNLQATILQCIEEYSKFGIFGEESGKKRYAFIHGDWALNNSRNGKFCGVNDEISILNKTGCFADFTFPSLDEANPRKINTIFYAKDDIHKPRSYDENGQSVRKNSPGDTGLMIIQGPLFPFFKNRNLFSLRITGDVIDGELPGPEKKVRGWVNTGIHIKGKSNWIIIKAHTHGAVDASTVLGEEMDEIFLQFETKYNDGKKFVLHYVTARELYNIIRAVVDGKDDDNPEVFRDYLIKPPQYDSTPSIMEASSTLQQLISRTYTY